MAINLAIPASSSFKGGQARASLNQDAIQKALRQAQSKLVADSATTAPVVFI